MQENKTRYPSYDVMKEQEHWDEHSREIVMKRLGPFCKNNFLTDAEEKMVRSIARHIVYDERKEILDYIVHHFDNILSSPIGEDQRKVGTPPREVLIRQGLKAIDKLAQKQFKAPFLELDIKEQFLLLESIDKGEAMQIIEWQKVPQKELFKKLAVETVNAYYSHPVVWSEIGYGGPAYPRGYVRVEKGLTDPWEAKRDVRE